jgi:hypothetical protein
LRSIGDPHDAAHAIGHPVIATRIHALSLTTLAPDEDRGARP